MRQRFRLTMKLIENILFDIVTVIVYSQVIPTVLQKLDLQGDYWSHKHSLWKDFKLEDFKQFEANNGVTSVNFLCSRV